MFRDLNTGHRLVFTIQIFLGFKLLCTWHECMVILHPVSKEVSKEIAFILQQISNKLTLYKQCLNLLSLLYSGDLNRENIWIASLFRIALYLAIFWQFWTKMAFCGN